MIALLAACQPTLRSSHDRVVVSFRSKDGSAKGAITERDVRSELARLRFEREGLSLQAAALPPELRSAAIERLIERRVLLTEAKRVGVETSTTEATLEVRALEAQLGERELERRLLDARRSREDLVQVLSEQRAVARMLREVSHAGVEVTREELEAAWAALPEEQRRSPARVRARQIVVVTEEEGKLVLEELKRASFAEVALRHSIGPEAAKGGELGWVVVEDMPAAFAPLAVLAPGRPSAIYSSDYGFHVFEVLERQPARELGFEDKRPALEEALLRKKLERAEADTVAHVMSRYTIDRNTRAIARIE